MCNSRCIKTQALLKEKKYSVLKISCKPTFILKFYIALLPLSCLLKAI